MLADQVIATPDVVMAHCFQLILMIEAIRLVLLILGRGIFIYDHPKPPPPPPWPYDWAVVTGWPA